ncbi:MAG: calcium-binding protein [Marinibacterium sp.]|nr:calcium-binding protein [Marinibacterium sp.]
MNQTITGTSKRDTISIGSGTQTVLAGLSDDTIVSFADAGEPDPAQTTGSEGRVTSAIPAAQANDVLTGGGGADRFEFRALLDATDSVKAQHMMDSGRVNWAAVTGENDNVHDHWVVGFGLDTITDYSKTDGDTIVVTGHTVTLDSITYGTDDNGSYSLLTIYSQQGDGANGGANTDAGAHDEDPLGQIKVYGDRVTEADVKITRNNDGIDQLDYADTIMTQIGHGAINQVYSNTDNTHFDGSIYNRTDIVEIGQGRQDVDAGGGSDTIVIFSDGGEPDPARTTGSAGRHTPAVPEGSADDLIKGGQGADTFHFQILMNASPAVKAASTRDDGSIAWYKVARADTGVHDHWMEGIGNDTILDYSKQDGDEIRITGHDVRIGSFTYGEDAGGDFTLISLESKPGGAHGNDPLGTIKVYGDRVAPKDVVVDDQRLFGVSHLDRLAAAETVSPAATPDRVVTQPVWGAADPETIDLTFTGTGFADLIEAGSGSQTLLGGGAADRLISYGDAGEPDPAQTVGSAGRITPALAPGASDDVLTGGAGGDRFEFRALLNARAEVLAAHTGRTGHVNWERVAGENDNPHDHWVEGIGNDVITDYSKAEGDKIVVRGHTVSVASVTYGSDDDGSYSLITLVSQQGNGANGGANTATGAHDEDPLGTIKVYGDKVVEADITVQAAGVFDGVDMLSRVDMLATVNGGVQEFASSRNGAVITTSADTLRSADLVRIGSGAQEVSMGAGNDRIFAYSDGGEPDPAQTVGAAGRITPAVDAADAADVISGGQGKDLFQFNMLLDATEVVRARHTADDGSIKWKKVAGENDNPHDHWVAGIGDDVITDYSKQDGDKIVLRGHTVEIAAVTYGNDAGGDYSLVEIRSQQGDGANGGANTATGAHDEDPLGTLKIYGDRVEASDITVQAAKVFDGIDLFEPIENVPLLQTGAAADDTLFGTSKRDNLLGRDGEDLLLGNGGNDFLFGEGDADILFGGAGNDWLEGGSGADLMNGGAGADTLVGDSSRDTFIGGGGSDVFMFYGMTKGGTITDWQDGMDKIDLSRAANVDTLSDVTIEQTSDLSVRVRFQNDDGFTLKLDVISETAFTLGADDFLL